MCRAKAIRPMLNMSATTATPAPVTRGAAPAARLDAAANSPDTIVESIRHRLASAGEAARDTVEFQVSTADAYAQEVVDGDSAAHNIIGAAITLGLSVIMLILMAIVAGYFVQEAPSDGAFSNAITQVEDIGGTGFVLLAVTLLAVPVVAVVGYFMRSGLGGFITGGGGMR